jgi:hypothetical protein
MNHPIELIITDDLRRNRLTVFFRLFMALPHLIWLSLWGIAAYFAVIGSWFVTLFAGQTPKGLHDFIAQYMRYWTHVNGYLYLLADPFPGFLGDRPYPQDARIAPPAPQNRWVTGFRLILAIPALIVAWLLSYFQLILAVFSWFVALVAGSLPLGLRNLGSWCLRFVLQTQSYVALLTDRYPSFDTQVRVEPTTSATGAAGTAV